MKTFIALVCVALFFSHAFPSVGRGQNADADSLSTEAIEKGLAAEPDNHAYRIIAGFHYFDIGEFAKAEENFARASKLTPEDPYDQIWLYMAQLRQNPKASDAAIRAFVKQKANKDFVFTDIQALLGDITANEGLDKARASGDLGNVCEMNFYLAQRAFANGDKAKAKEFLAEALKTQKDRFWEYKAAAMALKAL